MKKSIHRSIALGIAFLLTTSAHATTVLRLDLPQLVQQSDSIVQGHVESVTSQWDSTRNVAFTYVTINVEDPMKGERRRTIAVRQLGGKVGAMNVTIAGMPRFVKGEQVIVFLKAGDNGTFQIVGLNQGKYEITEDFAVSSVSGIDFYNSKTGRYETPAFVSKAPVESFKSKIRELLK